MDGYEVVICRTCGTAYADNIPPQSAFDAYYRELSKYERQHRDGKESEDDERRLREVAADLQTMIRDRAARVLEIGCANGRLLSMLKETGYANLLGIDPAPSSAEIARRLYDISVTTATLFDPPASEARYDYVVMLGVLEHIRDVSAAIRNVQRLLSDKGCVYVEVPDASHPIPNYDGPFQEFSTEHINFFSPASLEYAMEAVGFRTMSCKSVAREPRKGELAWVARGLFQTGTQSRTVFPRHHETENALRKYIRECRSGEAELRQKLARLAKSGKPIIVWGVGTHTRRLLANGAFAGIKIVAFVDSNPKYQGRQLQGIPVLSPETLRERQEPILISSCTFQEEIRRQIGEQLQLLNEVIVLY